MIIVYLHHFQHITTFLNKGMRFAHKKATDYMIQQFLKVIVVWCSIYSGAVVARAESDGTDSHAQQNATKNDAPISIVDKKEIVPNSSSFATESTKLGEGTSSSGASRLGFRWIPKPSPKANPDRTDKKSDAKEVVSKNKDESASNDVSGTKRADPGSNTPSPTYQPTPDKPLNLSIPPMLSASGTPSLSVASSGVNTNRDPLVAPDWAATSKDLSQKFSVIVPPASGITVRLRRFEGQRDKLLESRYQTVPLPSTSQGVQLMDHH